MLPVMTPSWSWPLLAVAISAGGAAGGTKRPSLDLRVVPQWGSPSTEFLFVGLLKGGADTEDLHCPTLEWQWDSTERSVQEGECPPFEPGVTRVERRFSIGHRFGSEGSRTVALVLKKNDKVLARGEVSFRVTWEKKPPSATFRDPR